MNIYQCGLAYTTIALGLGGCENNNAQPSQLEQVVQVQATGLPVAEGSTLKGRLVSPQPVEQELDLSTPEKAATRLIETAQHNNLADYMQAIFPSERNKPSVIDLFESMGKVNSQEIEGIDGNKILTIVRVGDRTQKCYLSFAEINGQYFIVSGGPRR